MYSAILLGMLAAAPGDTVQAIAEQVPAAGRGFTFRSRTNVNVQVGGFSAFRGGFNRGFSAGFRAPFFRQRSFANFRFGFRSYSPFYGSYGLGFRSYGYAAPFVASYYAAPFVQSYYAAPIYAAPSYVAPAYSSYCAPAYSAPAFSSGYGCDGGTAAAIQELRAAVAELRQALQYR